MRNAPRGGRGALQVTETATTQVTCSVPDKPTLTALARRWRELRLGCPRGCPLDHHECHLAEVRRG